MANVKWLFLFYYACRRSDMQPIKLKTNEYKSSPNDFLLEENKRLLHY